MSGGRGDALPPALIIVDDEIDHAQIIRLLLADIAPELPVEVLTETHGLLRRLGRAPRDALLLVDRLLDGREVFDSLIALRIARSDLTVVVLSAVLSEEDRQRALSAGADHAAQKPGGIAEWRALLAELLQLSVKPSVERGERAA